MQTRLPDSFLNTAAGADAEDILRRCVHCGFCNNACPTYLLSGDEGKGPRGRIYQIKRFLEGEPFTAGNLQNLDGCLTCQACESACPSGVDYLRLLEIARPRMGAKLPRPLYRRAGRRLAAKILLSPRWMKFLFAGLRLSPYRLPTADEVLPPLPEKLKTGAARRRAVLFDGCVQSAAAPHINAKTKLVLAQLGVACNEAGGFCCGALEWHLEMEDAAKKRIQGNVDFLHRQLADGAEAIVSTASGCGRMIADYGRVLADDKEYAAKAKTVSDAHRDIAEFLAAEKSLPGLTADGGKNIAFHCPCTLRHGQKQADAVPNVLARLGLTMAATADDFACCGSAGFYSLENAETARRLRDKKLAALLADNPDEIVTANIGCHLHLQRGAKIKIRHWIELLQIAPN